MIDCHAVAAVMRQVARDIVIPGWTPQGTTETIWEKDGPNDLVTAADRASEVALTEALPKLLPGSIVVGEEAVSADAAVLRRLLGEAPVWIVDPIDGTWPYAHGHREFAILVSLAVAGRTVAGFILDPLSDRLVMAGPDTPLQAQGMEIALRREARATEVPGALSDGYLPAALRPPGAPALAGMTLNREVRCAGHEYLRLLDGRSGFAAFNRTKPWDHTAGSFLVSLAGGLAQLSDGSAYGPTVAGGGLLVASNAALWQSVHDRVFAEGRVPPKAVQLT